MSEQQSNRTNMAATRCSPEKIGEPEGLQVADVQKLQSSVSLSMREKDHTILVDLRQELSIFAVPYRNVDKRIVEAIRLKFAQNITYEEAAIRVFGNEKLGRKIRYWQNRWQLQ